MSMVSLSRAFEIVMAPLGFSLNNVGRFTGFDNVRGQRSSESNSLRGRVNQVAKSFQNLLSVLKTKRGTASAVTLGAMALLGYKKPQVVAAGTILYAAYHFFKSANPSNTRNASFDDAPLDRFARATASRRVKLSLNQQQNNNDDLMSYIQVNMLSGIRIMECLLML